jgi:hypothetical protein
VFSSFAGPTFGSRYRKMAGFVDVSNTKEFVRGLIEGYTRARITADSGR